MESFNLYDAVLNYLIDSTEIFIPLPHSGWGSLLVPNVINSLLEHWHCTVFTGMLLPRCYGRNYHVADSPGVVQALRGGKGFYSGSSRVSRLLPSHFPLVQARYRIPVVMGGFLSVSTGKRGAEGERLSGTRAVGTGVKGGSLRLQFSLFILQYYPTVVLVSLS